MADRHEDLRTTTADIITRDFDDISTGSITAGTTVNSLYWNTYAMDWAKVDTGGYSNSLTLDTGFVRGEMNGADDQESGFGIATMTEPDQVNIGVVIRFTEDYFKVVDGMKFITAESTAGGAERPSTFMDDVEDTSALVADSVTRNATGNDHFWVPTISPDAGAFPVTDELGNEYVGDSYPGSIQTFRFTEWIDEWIYIEVEYKEETVGDGLLKFYVYTQDGTHKGGVANGTLDVPLMTIESTYTAAVEGDFISAYVMYYINGQTLGSTPAPYVDVSSYDVGTSFMGPPPGFVVSGATTVNATTHALTLTEYQASVTAGYSVEATTDALTLTEYAASVVSATTVNATTHAMSLTTIAASINSSTTVNAFVDELILTTYSAVVSYPVLTTTDVLTLTSYQASVSRVSSSTTKGSYDKTNIIKKEPFGIRA